MIETSSDLRIFGILGLRKSSAIFCYLWKFTGNVWKSLENVWKHSSGLQTNFGKSSEIFEKWSEIFGNCQRHCYVLWKFYITQRKLQFAWRYKKSLLVLKSISLVHYVHLWNIFLTLEDKFRMSMQPCNILYALNRAFASNKWVETIASVKVNYVRLNGFLHNVLYSFQNLWKALQTFLLKRSSQKTFLIPKFVIDLINNLVIGPRVVQFRE